MDRTAGVGSAQTIPGGLADRLVTDLVEAIAARRHLSGDRLPSESELAASNGVSRLTVREAMRSLTQKGLVSVEQGRGTFITPPSEWSPLDPVVLAARAKFGDEDERYRAARELTETRRLVEVGTARMAAERRTTEHLADLGAALEAMRRHVDDESDFVEADLAFHRTVMEAADNRIIAALFGPVEQLLRDTRAETSKIAATRRRAIESHHAILLAISARDRNLAEAAMASHLDDAVAIVSRR